MTPTVELKIKLRFLLNDRDNKSFTDEELDMLLNESDCVYCAASMGWILKAMQYESTAGEVQEYSIGDEKYKTANIKDLVTAAHQNADKFKDMCNGKNAAYDSSFILRADTVIDI